VKAWHKLNLEGGQKNDVGQSLDRALGGNRVGALAGLGLGDFFSNQWYLALVAGFLGTIVAALVRDFIVRRGGALGPDSSRIPTLVLV
jgi:hypothetical protein